ncbi:hypothetical protein BDQ17DRAFT_1546090 [Cyathus striatus]|nr:hypothetical protein BDQ17DRAFT_1546090 [Cyathus striatus]
MRPSVLFAFSLLAIFVQAVPAPVEGYSTDSEVSVEPAYDNGPNTYWAKREGDGEVSVEPAYANGPKSYWVRKEADIDVTYANGPNTYWVKREAATDDFDLEPKVDNGPDTWWARREAASADDFDVEVKFDNGPDTYWARREASGTDDFDIEERIDNGPDTFWARQEKAGDRVLCLGAYSSLDDLLNGLITDHELAKLERYDDERLYDTVNSRYNEGPNIGRYYADYSNIILRNLSKKEFVRGDGLGKWRGVSKISIGHTLLARICWSSDPSASMYIPDDLPHITRGAWAGDRFDLVLRDDVAGVLESDEWKDTTEELKTYVVKLFQADGHRIEESLE